MQYLLSRASRSIVARLAQERTLCAFDFDGTLSPIAEHPNRAGMRNSTRDRLARLATLYPCVVISGRARADVLEKLRGVGVASVIGNHGAETESSDRKWRNDVDQWIDQWKEALEPELRGIPGVWVEDKGLSLAIHYRQSPPAFQARRKILAATRDLRHVRVFGGKRVVNLAAEGAPCFVMDDGWFGQRKTDHAGLGDWYVNTQKFPHGLKPLINKVHSLNMDFGLWVEPEMVNPDSDLYRKHPDWVLNFTGRPRTEGRNQLVLNLARPDVHDYVLQWLDKLLTDNDISFIKWDYNRNWSEPGWPAVPVEQQKNVYIDFTRNYYDILAQLRRKHPNVEFESCSGGGSRVDLGVMALTDEVWPSDNTDAYDRLLLQDGFTYAYTPGIMMAWVTDSPTWVNQRTLSLEYRFLSSMQGSLGIGANLNKWTSEDFATAKKMVASYKAIRETVQRGSLYRLMSPREGEQSVTESVSRDGKQAVTFAFLHSSTQNYPFPRIHLRGLEEDATYKLHPLTGKVSSETPTSASGAYWMHNGVDVELRGDFQAMAFTLDRQ